MPGPFVVKRDKLQPYEIHPGTVSVEFASPVPQSKLQKLYVRFYLLLSGILDTFSFSYFCLSFATVFHVLGSMCCRLIAEHFAPCQPVEDAARSRESDSDICERQLL